jgi:hypothetical protein
MTRYKFRLDNIRITKTRSRHEDTVYVAMGLKTGDQPVQTLQKRMGDLNDGTYNVGLESEVDVNPGTKVVMSYLVVNSGNSDPSSQLSTISTNITKKLYDEDGGTAGDNTESENTDWWSYIEPVIEEIVEYGIGLFFANCDGWLAGEKGLIFTDSSLNMMMVNNPYRKEIYYPGYDSAEGCGKNSQYYVTWEITAMYSAEELVEREKRRQQVIARISR